MHSGWAGDDTEKVYVSVSGSARPWDKNTPPARAEAGISTECSEPSGRTMPSPISPFASRCSTTMPLEKTSISSTLTSGLHRGEGGGG